MNPTDKSITKLTINRLNVTQKQFCKLINYNIKTLEKHFYLDRKVPIYLEYASAFLLWSKKMRAMRFVIEPEEVVKEYGRIRKIKGVGPIGRELGIDERTMLSAIFDKKHHKHVIVLLATKYLVLKHTNIINKLKGDPEDEIISAIEERLLQNSKLG